MPFAVRFLLKFGFVLLLIRIGLGIVGWFAGETIQDMLPDDGVDVYTSLEAAQRAVNRGHEIADRFENGVFVLIAVILAPLMWRRQKAAAEDREGTAADVAG